MITITTLIENMPDNEGRLLNEHGLSLYIEVDGKNILFDTGQTEKFISNAKALNKSLEEVDAILLSHGHYDHSGGLSPLLALRQENPSLKPVDVYVGDGFFNKKYKYKSLEKEYYYNGNPFTEQEITKKPMVLHKVKEDVSFLTPNCMIFKNFERTDPYEVRNSNFYLEQAGMQPDDFSDEIALGIKTEKGLVIVVGCSHVGIINIVTTIARRTGQKIYAVLGGTHLVGANEERIYHTIQQLRNLSIATIAVSHCTGDTGMKLLHQAFHNQFLLNNTGNVFYV